MLPNRVREEADKPCAFSGVEIVGLVGGDELDLRALGEGAGLIEHEPAALHACAKHRRLKHDVSTGGLVECLDGDVVDPIYFDEFRKQYMSKSIPSIPVRNIGALSAPQPIGYTTVSATLLAIAGDEPQGTYSLDFINPNAPTSLAHGGAVPMPPSTGAALASASSGAARARKCCGDPTGAGAASGMWHSHGDRKKVVRTTTDRLSFSEEHVRALTGLSVRRLRYWDDTGFFAPTVTEEGTRLYSFRDLVALRVIAQLRKKVSLQGLRKSGERLAELHETPWSSIKFYVSGDDVYFADPETGRRMATKPTGQRVEWIEMQPISVATKKDADELRKRKIDQFGSIGRSRRVAQNAYVIAGTRIPSALVWRWKNAGASDAEILSEYPTLTAKDIAAAMTHENGLQQRKRKTA